MNRWICSILVALELITMGACAASVDWRWGEAPSTGTLSAPSSGWPGCGNSSVKQYSGYFNISSATNKNYFYWAFESQNQPSTDPIILWLTGGPGCSGSLAIFAENGACKMDQDTGKLYTNPWSWNKMANIIYVDQPAGVGFSFADVDGYDHNEAEVSEDMFHFMRAFYTAFPNFKQNELFVYGESYGGHFAPATAHRIWLGNQRNESQMNLKGLSVGNGLTDPSVQYRWYNKLGYNWCKTVKGEPCISEALNSQIEKDIPHCIGLIDDCNKHNESCKLADSFCNNNIMGPFLNLGWNPYDITKKCPPNLPLCYNFSHIHDFLNRKDVQQALGVPPTNWTMCNFVVNGKFTRDWMHDFDQYVPDLLHSNIRVLIYAGDYDYICNWLGNKAWTLGLEWKGHDEFLHEHDLPWYQNNRPAGIFRTLRGKEVRMLLTFITIHDAGHMVPMDQPERAFEMVRRFLADDPFYGYTEW